MAGNDPLEGIAIIGMAGRFPGARNVAQLWENLKNGVESVTFFTPEELRSDGVGAEELAALRALSQQEGFTNIEVIAASESDPHLPANLDGVVILNSYHELTDYKSTLAGIKRALRPAGLLVLVDNNPTRPGWFTERNDQASHHALNPKYVDAELREAGFEIVNRRDDFIVQPYAQWLIVARPFPR